MIHDLSETLRAMLTDPAVLQPRFPELAAAVVSFDRPAEGFAPAQTTLDLFLFDIREEVELRDNVPIVARRDGATSVRRPPVRVSCSYLVTAWPVGLPEPALAEQRLLGQAYLVLAANATIPDGYLRGSLRGQEPPPPLRVKAGEEGRPLAEFWAAVGGKLRPALAVVATIALDPYAEETPDLVVVLEARGPAGTSFRIGGRLQDAAGAPAVGARLTIRGRGQSARSDARGQYQFAGLPAGGYTLDVEPPGQAGQSFPIQVPPAAGGNYDIQLH